MRLNVLFTPVRFGAMALLAALSVGCERQDVDRSGNTQSLSNPNNPYSSANPHIISEEQAAEYIQRFSGQYPGLNTQSFYTKRALYKILAQPSVQSVRYYFGQDENKRPELVMVGADENDNDAVAGNIIKSSPASLLYSQKEQVDWQDDQLTGLETAAASTERHRAAYPEALLGGLFPKEAIHLLLVKEAVFGVFIEYGLSEDNAWVSILRPLDKSGSINPIMIIELAKRCPPSCGEPNALNSEM